MRRKIIILFLVLIVVLTIIFSLIIRGSLINSLIIQAEENLINELKLAKKYIENRDEFIEIQHITREINEATDVRVTIINMEGVVLAETDEDPEIMANHLNREEIIQAIRTQKPSVSLRYSNTVKSDYLYAAVPITYYESNYILRIARPLNELKIIDSQVENFAFYSIAITLLFIIILTVFITKKITEPIYSLTNAAKEIEKGNYGKKIYNKSKDEIGLLANAFNKMSMKLEVSISEINQRNIELETILNNTVNGIIAVDKKRNILIINKVSFEILELPYNYVAEGESIYKIVRSKEIIEMIDDTIINKTSQVKELKYIHSDKILQIYINPILDKQNETIGSIIVLHDVTNLRKLEKMRSDFVSNVSHELKTPLTSIKGFVEALKEGALNDKEKAERFLDIIDIETDRLYRLINDILKLSEIENLQKDYDIKSLKINKIAEEVVEMLKYKIKDKDISIKIIYDKDYYMEANQDRMKQLFINLIDNSIKYTEKGQIKVEFSEKDKWNKIIVSDTGVGFEEKHKERLFERFYRADESRSRAEGGTGLGLSIVKHIVLLYNGKISIKSSLGEGTEFEMLFPKNKQK